MDEKFKPQNDVGRAFTNAYGQSNSVQNSMQSFPSANKQSAPTQSFGSTPAKSSSSSSSKSAPAKSNPVQNIVNAVKRFFGW